MQFAEFHTGFEHWLPFVLVMVSEMWAEFWFLLLCLSTCVVYVVVSVT